MLNNFWYACEFSHVVNDQPKQIELWNQKIVLYRDAAGKVVALKDQCPHRGATLSLGKVEDGCIQCPYHGWKFQTDGTCNKIPANPPNSTVPKRARVASYPAQEKYGFVWLFWGDRSPETCPPLPSFPNFPDSRWQPVYTEFKFNAPYTEVLENMLDPTHTAFVHSSTFGSVATQEVSRLGGYDVQLEEWGGHASITSSQPKSKRGLYWNYIRGQKKQEVKSAYSFYLPNAVFFKLDFKFSLIHYNAIVPVNETTTLLKQIQFRNFFTHTWANGLIHRVNLKAFQEDQQVLESLSPLVCALNGQSKPLYSAGDELIIAYHQLRRKCLKQA